MSATVWNWRPSPIHIARPYHTARIYIFGENEPGDPWRLSVQVPEEQFAPSDVCPQKKVATGSVFENLGGKFWV